VDRHWIYTAEQGGFGLWSVDPVTGQSTFVGSGPGDALGLGSTADGKLYGLSLTGANIFILYSINPQNGASSLIGETGLAYSTSLGTFVDFDLSVGADQLYFAYSSNLYRLNTATGAATLVGEMGPDAQIGAMVFEDGLLYASADLPTFSVATLNTATAAATIGPDVTGTGSSIIALAPPAPEPATAGMIGLGCVLLVRARRRQ
jgi:hypothetical protein